MAHADTGYQKKRGPGGGGGGGGVGLHSPCVKIRYTLGSQRSLGHVTVQEKGGGASDPKDYISPSVSQFSCKPQSGAGTGPPLFCTDTINLICNNYGHFDGHY